MKIRSEVQIFRRFYYAIAVLALAAAACFPGLVPISYQALGFLPELADAGTFEAFQAHLATASLRHRFLMGMLALAFTLGALSLAAIILRLRRRIDVPWLVMIAAAAGSAGLAVVSVAALTVGICC